VLLRHARMIATLLALGVALLGACQSPLELGGDAAGGNRPANDDFAARAVLESAAGTISASNVHASAEVGEPDHAGHPAGRSVWWTWTAPFAGTAAFDAAASGIDALLGVYAGASLATLAPVAQTDGTGGLADRASFDVAAGDVVQIAVDGLDGAMGAIALGWALDTLVAFDGSFEPAALTFSGAVGGPAPAPRAARLTNEGGVRAPFTIASDRGWLLPTPTSGALDAGASTEIWIAVDACTAHGSEAGSVFVAGGAAAAVAVRRDCTTSAADPTLDLAVERVYVSQSVPAQDSAQPAAARVPLVTDRPGLLRVFVRANEPNAARPIVRLHYRHHGGPEATIDLDGPDAVPTDVDEGILGHTFNAWLDADVLRPGLAAYVAVTLAGEADTSNNRFPAEGSWVPDVAMVPDARFTLVPVTYRGVTPAVGDGAAYLGLTERMFPLAAVDIEVRAPYAFTGDLDTGSGWANLLTALTSLRSTDGSDRHYYGVVDPGYGGGIAGIAWVGHQPVAVGWHHLPSGATVATHELGHNWGRQHAPCGVSGDPGYPYPGGLIGVWGYDRATGQLKSPATHADVMGYCSPVWASDYTYRGVLDYRSTYGYATFDLAGAAPVTVVLASGRIDHDTVELDPLFVLDGAPQPIEAGPYDLVGLDADGREVVRVAFDAAEVSHLHVHAFHLAIPVDVEAARGLRSVRIEHGGRVLAERVAPIRTRAAVPAEVAAQRDGSVAIAWDAGAYLEVLVRDGEGGPVLGRDRSGRLTVRPTARVLELLFSDGVTTERAVVGF